MIRFFSAFDPAVAELSLQLRALVLEEAAGCRELIYDSYNALSIAFSYSGRLAEAFCHIAVYSRHVNLGFNRGAELPDAKRLLQGSGRRIRHLKVRSTADLQQPHLREFVRAAVAHAEPEPGAGPTPVSRVRAASARKRRPAPPA